MVGFYFKSFNCDSVGGEVRVEQLPRSCWWVPIIHKYRTYIQYVSQYHTLPLPTVLTTSEHHYRYDPLRTIGVETSVQAIHCKAIVKSVMSVATHYWKIGFIFNARATRPKILCSYSE